MGSEMNQLTSYDIADGWQAVSVALVVARGVVVLAGARHWFSEWGGVHERTKGLRLRLVIPHHTHPIAGGGSCLFQSLTG